MAATLTLGTEDPGADDVRELLHRHLAFSRAITPPEHAYIVESDDLGDPDITLFGARQDGTLVAVGAIRELAADHAELKSMHVHASARGQGVGRATLGPSEGEGCDHTLARFVDPANGERRAPEPASGSAAPVRPDRTCPVPPRGP